MLGGGVGPMAGVELHRKIIEQTITGGIDQGHLNLVHFSFSAHISDRTDYLLKPGISDPGEEMASVVELGLRGLKTGPFSPERCIVGVPCNTFHAPKIFDSFTRRLQGYQPGITLVHMLKESIDMIQVLNPEAKKIGLMSTSGTRSSGVWHALLESAGYGITEVAPETQEELHDTIYNPEWGLKAVSPASEKARKRFSEYAETLIAAGADILILGCTEIPLALPGRDFKGTAVLDPVLALARAMIRAAGPEKLKPLT